MSLAARAGPNAAPVAIDSVHGEFFASHAGPQRGGPPTGVSVQVDRGPARRAGRRPRRPPALPRLRVWWLYPLVALPALGWAARAEEWYREPGFFLAAAVALVGLVEAIVFCLTPDERWDARWNPGASRSSSSGWAPVLIAIAALMLGSILMMSVLAIALEGYFAARSGTGG